MAGIEELKTHVYFDELNFEDIEDKLVKSPLMENVAHCLENEENIEKHFSYFSVIEESQNDNKKKKSDYDGEETFRAYTESEKFSSGN